MSSPAVEDRYLILHYYRSRVAMGTARGMELRAAAILCLPRLKVFFRPQRKFDHTFKQLIGGKTNGVAQNKFLGVKAHKVPDLKRLGTRRENEVSMSIVYDD